MTVISSVTCLGCGCACDDIAVTLEGGRIVEAANACRLGREWFGDGQVPANATVGSRPATLAEALGAAAVLVRQAKRPLVYLAPGLTCEAQREGVALADAIGAALDTVTSATALGAILAAQERGRASATLGEARHRADVVVWWGVDPERSHPRFPWRYAPMPPGLYVPEGRTSRTVIAVDIGDAHAPADHDRRFSLPPQDEIATLVAVRALVDALSAGGHADAGGDPDPVTAAIWARARLLAAALLAGRYVVIVADAESAIGDAGDPARASALIALTQALNGPTRCALSLLRGGGNRSGADAVLTSHTGYPTAVDFSRGAPRYRPHDGTAGQLLARGEVDAVIVVGDAAGVPADLATRFAELPRVMIGPRATASPLAPGRVAIDTGLAGVHDAGTALRLDDVPLPVRALVEGPPPAASVVERLRGAVVR